MLRYTRNKFRKESISAKLIEKDTFNKTGYRHH